MKFKSANDMRLRKINCEYSMTPEQKDWIKRFELRIKNKLDKIYEESPHVGATSIHMDISRELVQNVNIKGFTNEMKDIEDSLKTLGYKASLVFRYCLTSKLLNGCELYLEW